MKELFQKELVETALQMGATDAKIFDISDIAFDPRTLLKCLFGCPGGYHFCPTTKDAINTSTYTELIQKYRWGILICSDNMKTGQEVTLALESKAFLASYYFAFGATECANCETCSYSAQKPCVHPREQRPPLYSLGIDVYKTARGLGWELNVVQEKGDAFKNITAVFVE